MKRWRWRAASKETTKRMTTPSHIRALTHSSSDATILSDHTRRSNKQCVAFVVVHESWLFFRTELPFY